MKIYSKSARTMRHTFGRNIQMSSKVIVTTVYQQLISGSLNGLSEIYWLIVRSVSTAHGTT